MQGRFDDATLTRPHPLQQCMWAERNDGWEEVAGGKGSTDEQLCGLVMVVVMEEVGVVVEVEMIIVTGEVPIIRGKPDIIETVDITRKEKHNICLEKLQI